MVGIQSLNARIRKNFPCIGKWWEYLAKELQAVQRWRGDRLELPAS